MVAADVEQLRASGQLRDSLTTDVQDDAELRGSKQGQFRESLANVVVDAVKTSNRMSAPSRGDTSSASRLRPDAKLQLHGRDGDIQALRTRLRALAAKDREDDDDDDDPGRSPELLLVSGASGCGKSALVMRGLRDPAARMGLTFASGKFDQNKNKVPLSAIAQAMASLARAVADHKSSQKILREIRETLGGEDAALIADALPGTGPMLQGEPMSGALKKRGSSRSSILRRHSSARLIKGEGAGARLRLQYAVRRLLKVVCSNVKGLVLFLDDLQWSDTASLEMITRIVLDREIPSILVVGAYREDEVSDFHPLTLQLREGAQLGISTTTMNIGNLGPVHVKSLVADKLSMEDYEDAVSTLAATVHKKTDGNVFYVLLFLRSLAEEEILQYNFGTMKWHWDDEAVKAKLVTQNVATVLVDLLRSTMSESSQNALKVAACLGTSFSPSLISLAMEEQDDVSSLEDIGSSDRSVSSDISSCVDELEGAGLLEREGDDVLRFAHDQIQQSSLDLIPEDNRVSFKSELGGLLMKKMDQDSLDDNLFEVVTLRNSSIDTVPGDERVSMAKLNLRAGMKAAENGAFDTAEVYFKAGRELLGDGGWKDKPDMTIQLYSEGANACLVCGDFETMDRLVDQVLDKDISIEAKIRCYEVKIRALTAASDWEPIIDLGMEVRRQLGQPVMKNKPVPLWKIMKEYVKTNGMLKKVTSDDIATMPQTEDKKVILGQLMMERILPASYHAQPTLMPMMVFNMVQTSIRHGNNSSACIAFASMGMLYQCIFGNPSKASDLAVAADQLLNSPDVQEAGRVKARAIQITYCFVHHWHSPIQQTLAPFIEGYQAGLYSGDTEAASYNLSSRSIHLFSAGRPLPALQHELESYASVCAQLNQSPAQNTIRADLVSVRKLRNTDNGEDSFEAIATNDSDIMIRAKTAISRMELFVLFRDWSSAIKLLREREEDPRAAAVGSWVYIRYTFLESLVSFKAAQAASSWATKRRWKNRGIKLMKQLGKWISKGGNPNTVHSLHLLTAELAALKGNHSQAKESFKKAALVATTNGFVQDKGLAHALASAYYAGQGDQYWADYHMTNSQDAFRDWGATALLVN